MTAKPDIDAREDPRPPRESFRHLSLRFLRFGLLAWGGPVAQIAMIRKELVDDEHWISHAQFNRVLALYQVLPGPEATELCVYFGLLSRGRIGGLLAGLGFVLPGFVLMLALSWFYVAVGIQSPLFGAALVGFQAAVVALIVRAVHRIGMHAVHDRWLLAIAAVAFLASTVGIHFIFTLTVAGVTYALASRRLLTAAVALEVVFCAAVALYGLGPGRSGLAIVGETVAGPHAAAPGQGRVPELFASGLKAGLLTFGGAYTAIPFVQQDAVASSGWLTNDQFLEGLALSGIVPAPLIIFATFVGYYAGGLPGSVAMTIGIFLPAFAMTLLGHGVLSRITANPSVHGFLDGVTAGVVGLIAATTIVLFRAGVTSWQALIIFGLALAVVYVWQAKIAVAAIVLGAGLLGLLFFATPV